MDLANLEAVSSEPAAAEAASEQFDVQVMPVVALWCSLSSRRHESRTARASHAALFSCSLYMGFFSHCFREYCIPSVPSLEPSILTKSLTHLRDIPTLALHLMNAIKAIADDVQQSDQGGATFIESLGASINVSSLVKHFALDWCIFVAQELKGGEVKRGEGDPQGSTQGSSHRTSQSEACCCLPTSRISEGRREPGPETTQGRA